MLDLNTNRDLKEFDELYGGQELDLIAQSDLSIEVKLGFKNETELLDFIEKKNLITYQTDSGDGMVYTIVPTTLDDENYINMINAFNKTEICDTEFEHCFKVTLFVK